MNDYRDEERRIARRDVAVGATVMSLGGLQSCYELMKQAVLTIPSAVYGNSDRLTFNPSEFKALAASMAVTGIGYVVMQQGVRHDEWVNAQHGTSVSNR